MSKIIKVIPNDDYTLLIEFEPGDQVMLNMQKLIKTMKYSSLRDVERFKNLGFEDKTIYWSGLEDAESSIVLTELTVDNIFCMLED